MKLSEALTILKEQPGGGQALPLFLACGFESLHLNTFLKAELAKRFPARTPEIQVGLYGDLFGTLNTALQSKCEAVVVVVEWSDLDPRLGLRSSGGFGPSSDNDILQSCVHQWERLAAALEALCAKRPVVFSPPSYTLPLFGHTTSWQLSAPEAELRRQAFQFLSAVARLPHLSILHPDALARLSSETARIDPKLELAAGFPYTLPHASALAFHAVQLLYPQPRKKGLISDLDDTLWRGIVGEVGPAGVSWKLSDHAQIHGLYQQQLKQLAEIGVLLGIVSKNNPAIVEQALARQDLYLPAESFFPIHAGWNAKSEAVAEVLATWNIGPEAVVFLDDSPMEVAEVQAAFPQMTCLRFPANHAGKALELFSHLRDLFGTPAVHREDRLRRASIRSHAEFQRERSSAGSHFVRDLQGRLTFDLTKDRKNARLLELINKTNQFNLNGVRITDGEWHQHLESENSVVLSAEYEDKFGPLGVIGVASGIQQGGQLNLTSWVLSCRAFSRRIEHHMLQFLFEKTGVSTLRFSFKPTGRNQPLCEFFQALGLPVDSAGELVLQRQQCPADRDLPHAVKSAGAHIPEKAAQS